VRSLRYSTSSHATLGPAHPPPWPLALLGVGRGRAGPPQGCP